MNEHLVIDELEPVDETGKPCIYIRRGADIVCKQARNLAQMGLNDGEIALGLAISRATMYRYKAWFPEFAEALEVGRVGRLAEVVDKLYESALGYSCVETKVLSTKNGIECVQVTKQYPPNFQSIAKLLDNRLPHLWRSSSNIEITSRPPGEESEAPEVNYDNLTPEELDQFEELLKKAVASDQKRIGTITQDT